ncbi:MAG: tetratricopeptide repeat protein [Acidobacteriota bacterium]|nr:tetratricopeptide repeat protein [Acidobacteriota bacterium]
MRVPIALLLLAASPIRFDVTDTRGKKPGGVSIEAGSPDEDGWRELKVISKGKSSYTLIWPFDGKAKQPDGPGPVPVVVTGGEQAKKADPRIAAYRAARRILNGEKTDAGGLEGSDDPFVKGVRLLAESKYADAAEALAVALRERERQLTRIPSEIYPVAMLYGKALMGAKKFDDASVAFLKAMELRPSDTAPRKARAEALIKAGKPEAAESLMQK